MGAADPLLELTVAPSGGLFAGGTSIACALGKGGRSRDKREGDGATPIGCFRLKRCYYRADRIARPLTALPTQALQPSDGWCDDPSRPHQYNRPIPLPFDGSHERLWREDALYDLIVTLGHNDDPPIPGLGSAIFLHVARPDFGPTEGCVALDRLTLAALLPRLTPKTALRVESPG